MLARLIALIGRLLGKPRARPAIPYICASQGYAPIVPPGSRLVPCPHCGGPMWLTWTDISEADVRASVCSACFCRTRGMDHEDFARSTAALLRSEGYLDESPDGVPELRADHHPERTRHATDHR